MSSPAASRDDGSADGARVRLEVHEHVAVVSLNRPAKHNALDPAMFDAIIAAAEGLARDPDVRAVVLHGEGPSFCSGLDLGTLAGSGPEPIFDELRGPVPNRFQRAAYDWVRLPVPVIAAIRGHCYGGGLQIALGADIRLSTPDARLSVREIELGLVPDMAITQTLLRLVPLDVAKELAFTGRIFSGEEAERLGVVTRTSADPLADARALAGEIATRSAGAVRAVKALFDRGWGSPPEEGLRLEADAQLQLLSSAISARQPQR